jgi:hypothetical protein
MIGKFQSTPPSWVDDRTSKLFGFADGFHDYDDNIRKYAKGSAPDSLDEVVDPKKWGKIGDEVDIKGSQELAPWKANSARVGYRLIHDPQTGPRISLMAYFYNDLERHLAEISQVKWGDCFVAEISIVDQVHVNQTFTRTKGTLIEPVTYQQTFPSGYVYKVWQLDPKGNLITQEIRAPRSVAQVGKATGQENWRPPTLYNALSQFVLLVNNPWNYYMGIALSLATPAWNGGWIVNLPFHGGSEKPQTDYKLWMKELERREYGAEESYQRMTSGGNTSGPTGSGQGITPGSPSCKTNCSTIPGQK